MKFRTPLRGIFVELSFGSVRVLGDTSQVTSSAKYGCLRREAHAPPSAVGDPSSTHGGRFSYILKTVLYPLVL